MKNYKINPNKISDLVNIAANLFTFANDDVGYGPHIGKKANQMHFVADLLKDLVNTAYPMEEKKECNCAKEADQTYANTLTRIKTPIAESESEWEERYERYKEFAAKIDPDSRITDFETFKRTWESLDKAFENLAKAIENHKPPKAGDF